MAPLHDLPPGFEAWLTWVTVHDGVYLEFYRAYDQRGRLDPWHSFWAEVPADANPGPAATRSLSFSECRRLLRREAPSWDEFCSATTPPERIAQWLSQAQETPPVAGEWTASEAPRPWSYTGVRLAGGGLVRGEGYVPCEEEDDTEPARKAAEDLHADYVVLRDALGTVLSVRDRDGHLARTPIAVAVTRLDRESAAAPGTPP